MLISCIIVHICIQKIHLNYTSFFHVLPPFETAKWVIFRVRKFRVLMTSFLQQLMWQMCITAKQGWNLDPNQPYTWYNLKRVCVTRHFALFWVCRAWLILQPKKHEKYTRLMFNKILANLAFLFFIIPISKVWVMKMSKIHVNLGVFVYMCITWNLMNMFVFISIIVHMHVMCKYKWLPYYKNC